MVPDPAGPDGVNGAFSLDFSSFQGYGESQNHPARRNMMKQQPGVMLYFDVREAISQLSYEEKGRLLDAILDYGQHHTEPGFTDRTLALIWPFVRKDIHRDAQRYKERQLHAKTAADKRWAKRSEPMPEDAQACSTMPEMPTTSTTSSPSSPSSPISPAAAATPTAAAAQAAPTAPSALPRTNGSALPDLVAPYLPNRVTPAEELAALKAQALEKLRALPPDA